ncbi:MAG TPA: hypothetical protein V6D47_21230 [Oscillatoriaceae cyanobacterium]
MDQTYLWLDTHLDLLFPVVWLGGLVTALFIYWAQSSHRLSEVQIKRIVIGLIGIVATYILSSAFMMGQTHRIALERAESLFHAPHAYIEFPTLAPHRLQDAAEQQTFVALLDSGSEVAAHHSSPVDKLEFSFAGDVRVFSLGKDSQNPDEYWLEMNHAPGFADQVLVRHFTSPALTAWLGQRRGKR